MIEIEKMDVNHLTFDSNPGDQNNDQMIFGRHQETESSEEDD